MAAAVLGIYGNSKHEATYPLYKVDATGENVRPLSFGGGIHHCLGAQLARIEGEIAFRRLAQRLPHLRLDDIEHPIWRPTITLRGLTTLMARW